VDSETADLEKMRASIPRFMELWRNRPLKQNPHGMELNHSWATWYLLDNLKPDVVVESGVWRGHSTWLIEQAVPHAEIYSFDVDLSNRVYVSSRAQYFEHDLGQHNWSGVDTESAVVFLDDHQDSYERLMLLSWLRFSRLIFEDNHPVGWSDFYSLKYLRAGVGYPVITTTGTPFRRARTRLLVQLRAHGMRSGQLPVEPNTYQSANAATRIATYREMPAVSLGSTNYYRGPAYSELGERVVELLPGATFDGENLIYNWLTYVELHR
jgi:hypothetical protein